MPLSARDSSETRNETLAPAGAGMGFEVETTCFWARAGLKSQMRMRAVAGRENECCRSVFPLFHFLIEIRLSSDLAARLASARAVLLWSWLATLATRFNLFLLPAIVQ